MAVNRARKAGEDTFTRVENGGCLAMHEVICADDFTSKNLTDGLVAEADAKDGGGLLGVLAKLADDIAADASLVRRAGARGDTNALGGEFADFVDAHGIIAHHLHCRPKLAEVLDEVVGEGVVVIDNEEHLNSEFRIVNGELFHLGKGLWRTSWSLLDRWSLLARWRG